MGAPIERWLEIHRRALDAVRATVNGLDQETLRWKAPGTGMSIAGDVSHICDAERYWMREVGFQPDLPKVSEENATLEELVAALDAAEKEHERLLRERPGDKDVLFGLGRVCQHALHHLGRMAYFRMHHQPKWNHPSPEDQGSLPRAFDLITETMIGA